MTDTSFKFRPHRGSLAKSMEDGETFVNKEAMCASLQEKILSWSTTQKITTSNVEVTKYGVGKDKRNGWDTHLVFIRDFGVLGFTDGPVDDHISLPITTTIKEY